MTVFELISTLAVNLAKILMVIGVFCVVLKIINKTWRNQSYNAFYTRMQRPLYHIHINATKFAIILGFIHGFTIISVDQSYIITGWALGIVMLLLLGFGVWMSIKNDSQPLSEDKDLEWRPIRITKWFLTLSVFFLLFLHYFPSIEFTI
ncbi:MAG: hypothetical protein ACFFFH_02870 [Candidatus Thorarchaeota archaeon]